jgi:hypothetical protein
VAAHDAVVGIKESKMATSKPKSKFAKRATKQSRSTRSSGGKRSAASPAAPPKAVPAKPTQAKPASASSKQEAVLGMLRQPKGTTIELVATLGSG